MEFRLEPGQFLPQMVWTNVETVILKSSGHLERYSQWFRNNLTHCPGQWIQGYVHRSGDCIKPGDNTTHQRKWCCLYQVWWKWDDEKRRIGNQWKEFVWTGVGRFLCLSPILLTRCMLGWSRSSLLRLKDGPENWWGRKYRVSGWCGASESRSWGWVQGALLPAVLREGGRAEGGRVVEVWGSVQVCSGSWVTVEQELKMW